MAHWISILVFYDVNVSNERSVRSAHRGRASRRSRRPGRSWRFAVVTGLVADRPSCLPDRLTVRVAAGRGAVPEPEKLGLLRR
jgi:hypothetical protein